MKVTSADGLGHRTDVTEDSIVNAQDQRSPNAKPADEQPRQKGIPEWLRRSRIEREQRGHVAVADITGKDVML